METFANDMISFEQLASDLTLSPIVAIHYPRRVWQLSSSADSRRIVGQFLAKYSAQVHLYVEICGKLKPSGKTWP